MKPSAIIALVACILALSLLAMCELKRQHNAVTALPKTVQVDLHEVQHLILTGHDLVAVMGTGSMQPYIPGGDDDGIVAYVQVERPAYSALRKGDLVVFRAGSINILHQIAEREGEDWISTGLHNSHYDGTRVTEKNIIGRVVKTYILK